MPARAEHLSCNPTGRPVYQEVPTNRGGHKGQESGCVAAGGDRGGANGPPTRREAPLNAAMQLGGRERKTKLRQAPRAPRCGGRRGRARAGRGARARREGNDRAANAPRGKRRGNAKIPFPVAHLLQPATVLAGNEQKRAGRARLLRLGAAQRTHVGGRGPPSDGWRGGKTRPPPEPMRQSRALPFTPQAQTPPLKPPWVWKRNFVQDHVRAQYAAGHGVGHHPVVATCSPKLFLHRVHAPEQPGAEGALGERGGGGNANNARATANSSRNDHV